MFALLLTDGGLISDRSYYVETRVYCCYRFCICIFKCVCGFCLECLFVNLFILCCCFVRSSFVVFYVCFFLVWWGFFNGVCVWALLLFCFIGWVGVKQKCSNTKRDCVLFMCLCFHKRAVKLVIDKTLQTAFAYFNTKKLGGGG